MNNIQKTIEQNMQPGNANESKVNFVEWERMSQKEKQDLLQLKRKTEQFLKIHQKQNSKPIIMLSSGGTSVPLQKNTVRMLQNFSTGTRGSILAQEILTAGFPLIFFYRDSSCLPFLSGVSLNHSILNQNEKQLQKIIDARKKLKQASNLLLLPFKTIYYYLNGILQLKQILPQKSILILCAAVSDFVPSSVSEHKIHTQQNLQIVFKSSPKILGELVSNHHLTVSFKLETDSEKIMQRINFALEKYKIDMVVGNLLNNKNWIKISINSKYFKQKQIINYEFHDNIERNIINSIIYCHKLKFS